MHHLATLRAGGYRAAGLTRFKLSEPLPDGAFPPEILDLGDNLEILDLSGTGLSSLPVDLGRRLPRLRIAFFSSCRFTQFPAAALAGCSQLEMVAFRSNGMEEVAEEAFADEASSSTPLARRLRWLILTDNRLAALPTSIGRCERLEKCMLAGNRLTRLPDSMQACQQLTLLRLAANRLEELPDWLLTWMPRLAFLSFAGNPCTAAASASASVPSSLPASKTSSSSHLPLIDFDEIEVHHVLGEGASGIISKGVIKKKSGYGGSSTAASTAASTGTSTPVSSIPATTTPTTEDDAVAVKIFRGALTSDGTPYDEMAANIAAGHHVNLVRVHGQIRFAEEEEGNEEEEEEKEEKEEAKKDAFKGGIVMELIPPHYRVLGQPPSFVSCTRDVFDNKQVLSAPAALGILAGVASAAAHLHARGIAHGDLYAHNILVRHHDESAEGREGGQGKTHALLSDFGASTLYAPAGGSDGGSGSSRTADNLVAAHLEKIEVLAFAHLVEDVLSLLDSQETAVRERLTRLHKKCHVNVVADRPTFAAVVADLEDAAEGFYE